MKRVHDTFPFERSAVKSGGVYRAFFKTVRVLKKVLGKTPGRPGFPPNPGLIFQELKFEKTSKEHKMKKYVCDVCGYVYDPGEGDPDNGFPAGTAFEKLPADWVCPMCGAGKDSFSPM